ncbi:MAG: hypothetical protein M5U34_20765 [Chloroflexi bacterium]|nr:hypothetical protein [Chloroflexota bacterium]
MVELKDRSEDSKPFFPVHRSPHGKMACACKSKTTALAWMLQPLTKAAGMVWRFTPL